MPVSKADMTRKTDEIPGQARNDEVGQDYAISLTTSISLRKASWLFRIIDG